MACRHVLALPSPAEEVPALCQVSLSPGPLLWAQAGVLPDTWPGYALQLLGSCPKGLLQLTLCNTCLVPCLGIRTPSLQTAGRGKSRCPPPEPAPETSGAQLAPGSHLAVRLAPHLPKLGAGLGGDGGT